MLLNTRRRTYPEDGQKVGKRRLPVEYGITNFGDGDISTNGYNSKLNHGRAAKRCLATQHSENSRSSKYREEKKPTKEEICETIEKYECL